jgi:hypothetical protein
MRLKHLVFVFSFVACEQPSAPSTSKALTAFSFATPSAEGTFTSTDIDVRLPYGTDLSAMVAQFVTTGVRVTVRDLEQQSGFTLNDFRQPVTYRVMAEDGSSVDYTVRAVADQGAATGNALRSFSLVSPAVDGVIVGSEVTLGVPRGTDLSRLVAQFTVSPAATVKVGATPQVSAVTANTFINPVTYSVIAQNGAVARYRVTATLVASNAKALTSFSFTTPAVSGSITAGMVDVGVPVGTPLTALVANFTSSPASTVTVGGVPQVSGVTSNTFTSPVTYRVTAEDGSTADYLVTVRIGSSSGKSLTAFSFVSPPVTATITGSAISASLPSGTPVTGLIATFAASPSASVSVGGVAQVSGTTPNDFTNPVTYLVTAQDGSTATYVVTVTLAKSSAHELTSFSIVAPPATGTIVGTNVAVAIPNGTGLTSLVASFVASPRAIVTVNAVPQMSGVTANDFTTPVAYVVTAEDGSASTYTVTVGARASNQKDILTFSFSSPPAVGVVGSASVALTVPSSTSSLSALVANFTLSPGASAAVGGTPQVSGATSNDFSRPVTYVVTAADLSTKTYTATATLGPVYTPVLVANFQTVPVGMSDNVEVVLPGPVAVPTVLNTNGYTMNLVGKLKVISTQAPPAGSGFSNGTVQFSNNTSTPGKIVVTQVPGPFELRVTQAPASTGDASRKLRVVIGGTEYSYFGDGGPQTVDLVYDQTPPVDVETYGFDLSAADGGLGKGVRVFDFSILK